MKEEAHHLGTGARVAFTAIGFLTQMGSCPSRPDACGRSWCVGITARPHRKIGRISGQDRNFNQVAPRARLRFMLMTVQAVSGGLLRACDRNMAWR